MQELAAELNADGSWSAGRARLRASALRLQPVPDGLPGSGQAPPAAMPRPEHGRAVEFALNRAAGTSLATSGMEMSWLNDPWGQGPGKVWMRLRDPLLPG